jgi:hypothetical protein
MGKCRLYEILFSIFPLKSWQDFIIRHHFDVCPSCQKRPALVEEVRSALLSEEEMQNRKDFWPEFAQAFEESKKKLVRPPHWRLIYGTVALTAVIIAGAWFVFVTKPERVSDLHDRFKINYIRIEDKPARAYLFQPQDSNMIFVWAEKNTVGD